MPHGGYHGIVKMGTKTVQQGSSINDDGEHEGGGVYNPGGYANDFDTGKPGDASKIIENKLSPTNKADAKKIDALNAQEETPVVDKKEITGLPSGGILQALYGGGAGSIENYQKLLEEGAYDIEGQHPLSQQFIRLADKYYGGDVEKFAQSSQGQVLLNYLQDVPYTKGGLLGLPTQELADKFEDLGLNVLTEKVLTGDDSDPFKTPTGSDITNLRFQPNFSRSTDIGKRLGALTSDEYKKFNEYLYATRPDLYAKARPFQSGKLPTTIAQLLINPTSTFTKGIANSLLKAAGKDPLKENEPFKGIATDNPFIEGLTDMGDAQQDQLDFNYLNPAINPNLSALIQPLDQGGMNDVAQAVINQNQMPEIQYGSRIGQPGPFTADFVDQDGDGADDRYQSGPGQPDQFINFALLKDALPEGGINTADERGFEKLRKSKFFDPNSLAFSIG